MAQTRRKRNICCFCCYLHLSSSTSRMDMAKLPSPWLLPPLRSEAKETSNLSLSIITHLIGEICSKQKISQTCIAACKQTRLLYRRSISAMRLGIVPARQLCLNEMVEKEFSIVLHCQYSRSVYINCLMARIAVESGVELVLLSLRQNVTGNSLCWSMSEFAVEPDWLLEVVQYTFWKVWRLLK